MFSKLDLEQSRMESIEDFLKKFLETFPEKCLKEFLQGFKEEIFWKGFFYEFLEVAFRKISGNQMSDNP